jgi:pimeloyl-ACP methyl ester carboxylesterase
MIARSFSLGGQSGWLHAGGFADSSGYFHTYDALAVGGSGDPGRKVHVFLPLDYESSGAAYPVIYMNDGDTAFWPSGAGKSWDIAGALADLYKKPAFPRVLVVAVHPLDRRFEYTHAPYAPGRPSGGLAAYTDYMADRVKGFIDAHYRTTSGPESTVIVGSSHGGLASFFMATRRPDRFGKAMSMSPSFWAGLDPVHGGEFSGGPLAESSLVRPVAATLAGKAIRPKLWIDWGLVRTGGLHNERIEAAAAARGREMVSLLQNAFGYRLGSDLFQFEDPLGEHDELSWSRRFPKAMRALFGPSPD